MSRNSKVLVTGAQGQLGSEIKSIADAYPLELIYTDVDELDLTEPSAIQRFFDEHVFDYCINCAAYTSVDQAEEEPELAFRINVNAVEHLARACESRGVHLFHISTDFVFNGVTNQPYPESAEPSPISIYGTSKLNGEISAMGNCTRTTVLRTSWLYSTFGKNFVKTMLRLGGEKKEIKVIYDQVGTPTYARDLAKVILDLIQRSIDDPEIRADMRGIFHYSNEGIASWYDFAYEVFSGAGVDVKLIPIKTEAYPTPARRPSFSVMDKEKIKTTFNITIPYWKKSLLECLKQLEE